MHYHPTHATLQVGAKELEKVTHTLSTHDEGDAVDTGVAGEQRGDGPADGYPLVV